MHDHARLAHLALIAWAACGVLLGAAVALLGAVGPLPSVDGALVAPRDAAELGQAVCAAGAIILFGVGLLLRSRSVMLRFRPRSGFLHQVVAGGFVFGTAIVGLGLWSAAWALGLVPA